MLDLCSKKSCDKQKLVLGLHNFAQSKCDFTKSMQYCAILFKTIDALMKMPSLINTSRIEVKCLNVKAT